MAMAEINQSTKMPTMRLAYHVSKVMCQENFRKRWGLRSRKPFRLESL